MFQDLFSRICTKLYVVCCFIIAGMAVEQTLSFRERFSALEQPEVPLAPLADEGSFEVLPCP